MTGDQLKKVPIKDHVNTMIDVLSVCVRPPPVRPRLSAVTLTRAACHAAWHGRVV